MLLKSEGNKVFIDVESSINSDQHYIQSVYNYLKSLTSNNITGSYHICSYQLRSILATAAEIKVVPWTSDAGLFTDSWRMIAIWLDRSLSYATLLSLFKEKYPHCTEIVLTTSTPHSYPLNITVSGDDYLEGFNQLKISGDVIYLTEEV